MARFPHLFRQFRRSERGASAAEFALVLMVFLGLILTTINLSMVLYGVTGLHYAAQRTARCLAMKSDEGEIADNDCLAQAPTFYEGPAIDAAFAHSTVGCGNTVTGTGSFELVTGLTNVTVPISASACYPLQ